MSEEEFFISLGNRIAFLRKEKGISSIEFAYRCDFDKSNLTRIEKGRTKPALTTLIRICHALAIELSDLFLGLPLPDQTEK